MTENEKWINEQIDKILSDQDKILFEDVKGCFINEHYRAAYVMCWVALIESLKRKINELANLDDANAKSSISRIKEEEDKKNSVDKLIFEEAKVCGIIEHNELSDLKYLWDKRCFFVHPYENKPTLLEVKHIISKTIDISLSRELLLNKTSLNEYIENLITKPHFLRADKLCIGQHAKMILNKTPQALYPYFFKTLLYEIGKIKDDVTKSNTLLKLKIHTLLTLHKATTSLEESVWGLEKRATRFPNESYIAYVHKDIWSKIPTRVKDILLTYFETIDVGKEKYQARDRLAVIAKSGILESENLTRYHIVLDSTNFSFSMQSYATIEHTYNRMMKELATGSYYLQNEVAVFLSSDDEVIFKDLNDNELESIGKAICMAAKGGAYTCQDYFNRVLMNPSLYKDAFKIGIAVACIERIINGHLDGESLKQAVRLLDSLFDENTRNDTYLEIYSKLDTCISNSARLFYDKKDLESYKTSVFSLGLVDNHKEQVETLFRKIGEIKNGWDDFD